MKYLVLWELELLGMRPEVVHAVLAMPAYAQKLAEQKKLVERYHIVGRHGGALIYEVDTNDELERLMALAPVYNFSRYTIYPLAAMASPGDVLHPPSDSPNG
jgi:muconolactone delta-isomerase